MVIPLAFSWRIFYEYFKIIIFIIIIIIIIIIIKTATRRDRPASPAQMSIHRNIKIYAQHGEITDRQAVWILAGSPQCIPICQQ